MICPPRALERLPAAIGKVGVFVNAEYRVYRKILVRRYKMDTIQLHGDEPPEMGHYFVRKGYRVIKAFGIEDGRLIFNGLCLIDIACQLFLFDTRSRQFVEGPGKSFDCEIYSNTVTREQVYPFFLKWSELPGKIEKRSEKIKHPKLAGLDLEQSVRNALPE